MRGHIRAGYFAACPILSLAATLNEMTTKNTYTLSASLVFEIISLPYSTIFVTYKNSPSVSILFFCSTYVWGARPRRGNFFFFFCRVAIAKRMDITRARLMNKLTASLLRRDARTRRHLPNGSTHLPHSRFYLKK